MKTYIENICQKSKRKLNAVAWVISYMDIKKATSQNQPPDVFYEKGVFKIFPKFTGKHQRQGVFFNKAPGFPRCLAGTRKDQ